MKPLAYILPIAIFPLMLFLIGCKKKDSQGVNASQYYVKYIVSSSPNITQGWANKINVSIVNEKNDTVKFVIDVDTQSESIIGPVTKNFAAMIRAEMPSTNQKIYLNAQIAVSKDNEPFVVKEIDNSINLRNSVELNYIVDY